MWLKAVLFSLVIILTNGIFVGRAAAGKLDVMTGWYSITAETVTNKEQISNLGIYRINYLIGLAPNIELVMGYSLMMSNIIGGDLGYGVDGAITYYPISVSGKTNATTENTKLLIDGIWRPYVGFGFSQRQFQSVQSTYAGFALSGGVERSLARDFDLKGEIRYLVLQGARDSSAVELSAVGGLVYFF